MALLDLCRSAVRLSHAASDEEIQAWIDDALADMARAGVRRELLDPDNPDPMVRGAVVNYVKANFGYDNSEAPRFQESYRSRLIDLLNSDANECAWGE